MFKIRIWVCS